LHVIVRCTSGSTSAALERHFIIDGYLVELFTTSDCTIGPLATPTTYCNRVQFFEGSHALKKMGAAHQWSSHLISNFQHEVLGLSLNAIRVHRPNQPNQQQRPED
jgi:hypothetical protein